MVVGPDYQKAVRSMAEAVHPGLDRSPIPVEHGIAAAVVVEDVVDRLLSLNVVVVVDMWMKGWGSRVPDELGREKVSKVSTMMAVHR